MTSPESSFLTIADKSTQLTRSGSGDPLLYLHSAHGEVEWTAFHDQLAQAYEVFLPAHPGFGHSEGANQVNSIEDFAWHYVDLLDEFHLSTVPVIGFSLGGWTAMELAIRRPERVSKLILVNSAGVQVDDVPIAELFLDDLDDLRELLFFDPTCEIAKQEIPETYEDPRILHFLQSREATARVAWSPYLHNPKLASQLKRISCPTLVLWGEHDRLFPEPMGRYLTEQIPQAEFQTIPGTGHMLPFEAPEEFARRCIEFLSK